MNEAGGLTPDGAMVTLDHMFEIWVYPELVRRGIAPVRENVRSALVVLKRDEPSTVRLSGEFQLMARVRATRAIDYGEVITASDFSDVENFVPADLDDDAAWIAFFTLPDGRAYLGFDFRYDLGKARNQIELAEEFISTAESALQRGAVAAALDNALSACELAVIIQMRIHVQGIDERNKHGSRHRWFDAWGRLGNVAADKPQLFRRLAELRGWARYGDDAASRPTVGEPASLCVGARELIDSTRGLVTRWTDDHPLPNADA